MLQYEALREQLRIGTSADSGRLTAFFPVPDGRILEFELEDSGTMSPELAAKYPEMRSWRGVALADRAFSIRLDHSQKGFRASIRMHEGTALVEPYCPETKEAYIVFFKHDATDGRNTDPYDE